MIEREYVYLVNARDGTGLKVRVRYYGRLVVWCSVKYRFYPGMKIRKYVIPNSYDDLNRELQC